MISKERVQDLALFGGPPAFEQPLHVGRPNVGERAALLDRIDGILDRRWFTNNGPVVQEFEQRVADLVGTRHCIAICNATVALEIAIRAVGLSGEVIVPSFTFIATAHALQWQQITPVFCDIDPETHCLDPNRVEELITPRTTGIIGVHLWGHACDVEKLTDIAERHRLQLMFDAAHAFASSYRGKMIGNFGRAEIFSFHATKFFNTFEGGAIVTNDDDLARKIRLMNNFGFQGYDDVVYIGTNGKMSEVCAAMGLTGLDSLDDFVAVNRQNFEGYRTGLSGVPGIRLLGYDEAEKCNYQYVVLEVDEDVAGLSRDVLLKLLWAENVLARRYFYPGCHRMEPYRSYFPHAGVLLPETEELVKRVLVLPTGTAVNDEHNAGVTELIRLAVRHADEINRMLDTNPLEPANQTPQPAALT